MSSQLQNFARYPLFQAVDASKANNMLQVLTTNDPTSPNKKISWFLFYQTFPMMSFLFPLYLWMNFDPKLLCFFAFVWSGCQIYSFCIINNISRTSKYSYELTPFNIHEVRSQIQHTQRIRAIYWRPDNINWVQ